jgi:L-ascorbate metabolism protein UlaG (beta-lactamase superfamily)
VRLPIASAWQALRSPAARHQNDLSTLHALEADAAALGLPPGLELTWLGTAGFRIAYQGTALLIDPYLSRPGLSRTLARAALRPDVALLAAHVPPADAILVGHTHFDHALDVPALALRDGARVYGSRSVSHLMGLHGAAASSVEVEPMHVHAIGPFEVTFVESLHSRLIAGLAVPYDGELTCDHLDGLWSGAYRCGQTWGIHVAVAGYSFYHQGSANLIDDRIAHRGVDCFLAGIAGRSFTRDYAARILSRLQPRVIVPHHFDDFFRPIDAELGFSLNVNLGGFVEEVARVSADFPVRTLRPLRSVAG